MSVSIEKEYCLPPLSANSLIRNVGRYITVDVFIKLLCEKIDNGHPRKLIQTVRGYGYILREESGTAARSGGA